MQQQQPDISKWVCMFPCFIDSRKTVADGRRLPVHLCVPNPDPREMMEALNQLLPGKFGMERKQYSRDYMQNPRFRVNLFEEAGDPDLNGDVTKKPHNAIVGTRKALFKEMARIINAIPDRDPDKLQTIKDAGKAAGDKKAVEAASPTAPVGTAPQTNNKKKSSKKKK